MKLLITGSAGFIAYHLTKRLAEEKHDIVCIDNINDYYDIALKYARLRVLGFSNPNTLSAELTQSDRYTNLQFGKIDLIDSAKIHALFQNEKFDIILHLAAQAGVRYSISHPDVYITSNVQGFLNILEAAKQYPPRHLVYASSSSVYGLNSVQPFAENAAADHPVSLYAASKKSNELMAHAYSQLYSIPTTGLRFFTVYGPWGRPDMAPMIFTNAILAKKPIKVFNNGNMARDFTYIDDIVEGITRIMHIVPSGDPNWDGMQSGKSSAPAVVYNIGNGKPVNLMDFIRILEKELVVNAELHFEPMQSGDVPVTWADCSALEKASGYRPQTNLEEGITNFVHWYRSFYG
jgi:UDP-glucuronate 4-epimerase